MSEDAKLTPEQHELTLEEARLATAQAQAETAKAQARTLELEKETRHLKMRSTVRQQIESVGIKPLLKTEELYTLLRQEPGVSIGPDETGEGLVIEKDGVETTMEQLVTDYAVAHPTSFHKSSMRHLLGDDDPNAIKCKADFKNDAEKIAWIGRFGADAYERLGMYRVPTLDGSKLTKEDWAHLKVEDKAKVIKSSPDGELVVSRILRRTRGDKK
jgi:hypothetical protein